MTNPNLTTRTLAAFIVLAFISLFFVNTFLQSPTSAAQAASYFSKEEIDKGLQFSYERKLLSWCGLGLQLALLTALVCTTLGRRLTDLFNRWTGDRWLLTLVLVGATFLLLSELISLPLGLARLEHSRAWHMTELGAGPWFIDWSKGLILTAFQGLIVLLGLYGLMWLAPRWWWLLATAAGTGLAVLYAFLMPELIDPLFYKFTPLTDPILRERVDTLANRAEVNVTDVLVMDASSRGRHTNAYFTGFGSTRRVVLYDTLLRSHPDDEMETILAHEIGHWRHDHIVKGIALGTAGSLIGLFLLSRILQWAVGRWPFCLTSVTDPAGLPLILLLGMLATWLTMPVQNGISRYFERQADAVSLDLARNPEAFIEAEKRLARDNLSNVAPTPFNVWMFSTHPPAVERIEMAEQWKKNGG